MSNINQLVAAECRAKSSGDVARALANSGKSTREIADQIGKSTRQALRYVRGEVKNIPGDVADAVEGDSIAEVLAAATAIDVGSVEVESSSGPAGSRNMGTIPVTAAMRAQLAEAGELYAAGDDDAAEAALSAALVNGYDHARGGGGKLASALSISNLSSGFRVI